MEGYPSWSADSKRIVFVRWTDAGLGEVRAIGAAGGKSTALTQSPGHYARPRFSPDGKLVVAFQLPWTGDMANHARIGVYDLTTQTWSFMFYPLDVVTSANGGWVGLSEIMALGNNRFAVIERDNQAGPDATIKKIYRIDLTGKVDGNVLSKTLVRDVLPDLRATRGHVLEKIEGLARLADGNVYLVNDNDGLDKGNGETQLIKLGKIFN